MKVKNSCDEHRFHVISFSGDQNSSKWLMIIHQSCVLLEENSKFSELEIFMGYREKRQKLHYEHNDIQLLLGIETSTETTMLISEAV